HGLVAEHPGVRAGGEVQLRLGPAVNQDLHTVDIEPVRAEDTDVQLAIAAGQPQVVPRDGLVELHFHEWAGAHDDVPFLGVADNLERVDDAGDLRVAADEIAE